MSKIIITTKNGEIVNFKTGEILTIDGEMINIKKSIINNISYENYIELNYMLDNDKQIFMDNIDTSLDIDFDKYDIYCYELHKYYNITNMIKTIQSGDGIVGCKVLDENMIARCGNGMKYELGKLYEDDIIPLIGVKGFHFCNSFTFASTQYKLQDGILRMFRVKIPKNSIITIADYSIKRECTQLLLATNKIILESEINITDILLNTDIIKKYDLHSISNINRFRLGYQFYLDLLDLEFIKDSYLNELFKNKFSNLKSIDSNWELVLDKILEKLDNQYADGFIRYYTNKEKRIALFKERKVKDLSCFDSETAKEFGIDYFLNNDFDSSKASIISLSPIFALIDSADLILNNIDNHIIKQYLRYGITIDIAIELIDKYPEWFGNHINEINMYALILSDSQYKNFLKLNIPKLHYNRLITQGAKDFDTFVDLFNKSNIQFKRYKLIRIRTIEQLEFVIKKCGKRYDMIKDILYFNNITFGEHIPFWEKRHGYGTTKYKYLVKKYSKLNREKNKNTYNINRKRMREFNVIPFQASQDIPFTKISFRHEMTESN